MCWLCDATYMLDMFGETEEVSEMQVHKLLEEIEEETNTGYAESKEELHRPGKRMPEDDNWYDDIDEEDEKEE